MKRIIIVLLFSLVSLTLGSCSKFEEIFTNGEPMTQDRISEQPYHVVCMYNNINVELIQSNRQHIEITCPENLIDRITTEVTGDTLIIRNENSLNWLRSYDYECNMKVYFDSLRRIEYASIGDLICRDTIKGFASMDTLQDIMGNDSTILKTTEFVLAVTEGCGDIDLTFDCDVIRDLFSNGTSCVTLRGKSSYSEHLLRSYGVVHAEELHSNFVRVQSNTTNDAYVWARTKLTVWINTIGNVYYKGHPYIEKYINGDGQVIRLE